MKKILSFILTIAVAGVMVSCSSGASSPGAAAKQYARWLADGQYEKFVDAIYFEPDTPADEVKQSKTMLLSLFEEKGAETLEEKGGVKSIEVLSEEISDDGKTATVELRQTYGNGETSEDSMDLILSGGKWLMEMDKG